MRKRMIALLLALVLAVTIAVPGTLAVRHDKATVTSDFSVQEEPADVDAAVEDDLPGEAAEAEALSTPQSAEPLLAELSAEIPVQGEGQAEPAQAQKTTETTEPAEETSIQSEKTQEEPAEPILVTSADETVSVYGTMPEGTVLEAEQLNNPFAAGGVVNTLRNLFKAPARGAAAESTSYAELNYLGFYDLKLYDNDVQVQPDGTVLVTIRGIAVPESGSIQIIHILDDAQAIRRGIEAQTVTEVTEQAFVEKFPAEAQAAYEAVGAENTVYIETMSTASGTVYILDGATIQFYASSFSIYAIVDDGGEVPRATYKFQNEDGTSYYFVNSAGDLVDNQILRNGESLQDVGRPDIQVQDNKTFNGWYEYDTTIETFGQQVTFGTPITVTTTKTVIVRPNYNEVVYLKFYADSHGKQILTEAQVPKGSTYDISQQEAPITDSKLAFIGWSQTPLAEGVNDGSTTDTRTEITNTTVTANTDMSFYPIFKSAHWIRFTTAAVGSGADFVPAAYVLVGEQASTKKPANPNYRGFTFKYWSETAPVYNDKGILQNNPPQFDWNQTLDNRDEDVMLYAVWENGNSSYTVIFWLQSVNDDKNASNPTKEQMAAEGYAENEELKHFDYGGQEVISTNVKTYDTVSPDDFSGRYEGFQVNEELSDQDITVKADGSSVINVYFDRKLIKMKFSTTQKNYTPDSNWPDTDTYTNAGNSTDTPQYALVDGEYVPLTKVETTTTEYYLTTYDVSRLSWDIARSYVYNTRPVYDTNGNTVSNPVFDNTYYQYRQQNWGGGYSVSGRLYWYTRTTTTVSWQLNGETYNGPRYLATYFVFTGLYGQTLSKYGYQWPNGTWSYYITGNGTSSMSYLGQFVLPDNVRDDDKTEIRLVQTNKDAEQTYEFFLQQPDGTYRLDSTVSQKNGHWIFGFSEKYDGYTVDSFRLYTGSGNNKTYYNLHTVTRSYTDGSVTGYEAYGANYTGNPGWQRVSTSDSVFLSTYSWDDWIGYYDVTYYNMEIRYRLKPSKLEFRDPTTGDFLNLSFSNTVDGKTYQVTNGKAYSQNLSDTSQSVEGVYYTQSVANYKPGESVKPAAPRGKVWDGKWYSDRACTQEFDWNQTMPNSDLVVYPGWEDETYLVQIDPNGGVLYGTEVTYRWFKYGETVTKYTDVDRNYVEVAKGTGDYAYVIFDYDYWLSKGKSEQEIWDEYEILPRTARYVTSASDLTEYEQSHGRGQFYEEYGISKDYKYEANAWALVGWYKVTTNGDGEETLTPYDFSAIVTGPMKIRAIWRLTGDYYVSYDLDAVDANGDPLLDDNNDRVTATSAPTDINNYADKSDTAMEGKAGAPSGYAFVGWYYDGHVYNPGDVYKIKAELAVTDADEVKRIHLKPVFMPAEDSPVETVAITWDGNEGKTSGGDAQIVDEDQQINAELNICSSTSFTRPGYKFLGWAKTSTATTPWIVWDEVNSKFTIDGVDARIAANKINEGSENILYAVWEKKFYTVTVEKVVEGSDLDKRANFTFTPYFSETVDGASTNFALNGLTGNDPATDSKVFVQVPYGSYVGITEGQSYGFETSAVFSVSNADDTTKNHGEQAYTNGNTLTVDGDIYITFTNTRTLTNLTIRKTGTNAVDENQTYIFKVTGTDANANDNINITVTVHGDSFVTIKDLPVGHYTVQELTGWSWRYSFNSGTLNSTTEVANGGSIELTGSENTLEVVNERSNPYWLSGDNFAVNVAGTGRKN